MEDIITTPSTPEATVPPTTPETTISEQDKVFAAYNDPTLAPDSFTLGPRTFKVVHLRYPDYLKFLQLLKPLASIFAKLMSDNAAATAFSDIEVTSVVEAVLPEVMGYLGDQLPEMVAVVCRQTTPEITAQWVIDNAKSPFELVGIVMQQVGVNQMIQDIGRFFKILMPQLTTKMKGQAK